MELMKGKLGVDASYTLGAHSHGLSVRGSGIGKTVHLIGFQGNIKGKHHEMERAPFAGALYAIRYPDRTYEVLEVNNAYKTASLRLFRHELFAPPPRTRAYSSVAMMRAERSPTTRLVHASEEVALGKKGRARNL